MDDDAIVDPCDRGKFEDEGDEEEPEIFVSQSRIKDEGCSENARKECAE